MPHQWTVFSSPSVVKMAPDLVKNDYQEPEHSQESDCRNHLIIFVHTDSIKTAVLNPMTYVKTSTVEYRFLVVKQMLSFIGKLLKLDHCFQVIIS